MKYKFLGGLMCFALIFLPGVCVFAQSPSEEDRLNQEITQKTAAKDGWLDMKKVAQKLNPEISLIVDTNFYRESGDEPVSELWEEAPGFGHSHGHGHEHGHGFSEGFNLREVELFLSAAVDPYFKGYATISFSEESSEIEEAVFQTTSLPYGFQVLGGKFLSHFGYINKQHPHSWDFVDRPLIYELTLGDHGLNEKGLQASWLAPTPFHLKFAVEALQGENEKMFNHLNGEELPNKKGPRLWVGWLKAGPNLPGNHGLQAGIFGATGIHQEAHDEDEDGTNDHWLDGDSYFYGLNLVYKYDAPGNYGKGDVIIQGEYFRRKKDLSIHRHDLEPDEVGKPRTDEQDGYYLQAVYGFLPRWRGGVRFDQVGLTNKSEFPDGTSKDYDDSYRATAMVDFNPSEFSRIRAQYSYGEVAFETNNKDYWQFFVQLIISLGSHPAHEF